MFQPESAILAGAALAPLAGSYGAVVDAVGALTVVTPVTWVTRTLLLPSLH